MWCIAVYDVMEEGEPLIAFCVLQTRGEYELFQNRFDDGSYRYKTITATELDSLRHGFGIDIPIKDISDFCLTQRFCEWSGCEF